MHKRRSTIKKLTDGEYDHVDWPIGSGNLPGLADILNDEGVPLGDSDLARVDKGLDIVIRVKDLRSAQEVGDRVALLEQSDCGMISDVAGCTNSKHFHGLEEL